MSHAAIDERIRLDDLQREKLEQLVDRALDVELDQIVNERIEARNGVQSPDSGPWIDPRPQAPPVPVPLVATSLVGDTNARAMGM